MLTSLQNPLVKQLRKLQRAKERQEQDCFFIEGTHLVEAALSASHPLLTVCYTSAWQQRYGDLWQQLKGVAQRVEEVSPDVLRAIATTVEPDGVVATLPRRVISQPNFTDLGLVLSTIQDPGNVGTMIRTVAAVGADGLLLSADSVDPEHPKVLRASAGQWFHTPIGVSHDLSADLRRYQHQGFQIVATLPTASLTYWQADLRRPSLIVLGNEGSGLSDSLAGVADCQVMIPQDPGVESLNVAIVAALLLYEAKRQRQN